MLKRVRPHIINIGSFIGTRLISIAAFALSAPFFIRHTSDAQYGVVAIGFSLLGVNVLFDVAVGYVITQSVGRQLARSSRANEKLLHGLFSVYSYASCFITFLLFFIALLLPLNHQEQIFYASLALLLPGLAISGVVAAIFQARNNLAYINLSRFGFELGKALALIVSASISHNIVWIGPVLVLVITMRAIVDYQLLVRKLGIRLSLKPIAEVHKYYKFMRIGFASFSTVVLTLLVTLSDKILIKEFFSESEVAYYSIAFDVNAKAYLLVNAVNTAMFAVILNKFSKRSSTKAPIAVGLTAVALVALVYYIPMFFFSEIFITLLVSSTFASKSAQLASVMSIASMLYLLGNVFENATTAMGDAKSVMVVYCVAVSAYFCSLPILADRYGVEGFMYAYVLLCTILCIGFVNAYMNRVNRQMSPRIVNEIT